MEQTNRTILFEEINPEVNGLLELIDENDATESLTDSMIKTIHQQLVVHSYEEAVEKFKPTISLELDFKNCFESENIIIKNIKIPLYDKGGILEKILLMKRRDDFKLYTIENVADLLEKLFVEEYYDEFYRKRIGIYQLFSVTEYKKAAEELKKLIDTYNNGLFLIIAFIKEIQQRMRGENSYSGEVIMGMSFPTQLKMISCAEECRYTYLNISQEQKNQYKEFVFNTINDYQNKKRTSNIEIFKELLLCTFEDEIAIKAQYKDRYYKYEQFYAAVMKQFWNKAKPLVETMLGIYEFFAQYNQMPPKKKEQSRMRWNAESDVEIDSMEPTLLIANCKAGILLQEKNRKRLSIYLETVNEKTYFENKIWYAIVPGVDKKNSITKNRVRERFLSSNIADEREYLTTEEVICLVDILTKSEIHCFISLRTDSESGFAELRKNGSSSFQDAFLFLDVLEGTNYVVPSYPNFSIIPKDIMYYITVGIEGEYKKNWLTGIEIEASYVAAGVVAACQCPKFLKRFYENEVDTQVPGVAYSFTRQEQSITTTMKREILDIDEAIVEHFHTIIDNIKVILERTPPELAADIYRHGVYLTGGASQVNHLAQLVQNGTGLKVNVSENPVTSVALGLAKIIKDDNYKSVAYSIEGMNK